LVGQRGLRPAAEREADAGLAVRHVLPGGFDHATIEVGAQRNLLAGLLDQPMNAAHDDAR